MNHQFIDCPNPACHERIPSRLKCRGHNTPEHKDLDYQVCTPCGYFRWLDPAAAMGANVRAQRRLAGAPANGAPPFPPPDNPEDWWARSPPSHALEWIDPALAMPVYSQALPPMPPPSQPRPLPGPSSQMPSVSQTSSKPFYASGTCGRRALSKDCSHNMCKTCCEGQKKGCSLASHRTLSAVQASSSRGDPSALSRPPPMFPPSLPPTPSAFDDAAGTLPLKEYRKPMNEEWARRYNANHTEREERKAAEEQRRQQQLTYDRQVAFYCWTQDGEEPEFARLQGITTFPKLNMADHPKLLTVFGLTIDDNIWIYDPDGGSFMREDVNHIMEVIPHQRILTRLAGVKKCPGVDELIDKHCRNRAATNSGRRALPAASHKRKSPHDGNVVFPPSLKTSQSALLARPSTPPSPRSSSSSSPRSSTSPIIDLSSPPPSRSSSRQSSSSSARSSPLPPPAARTAPYDPDSLWAEGRVFVQSGLGEWPNGVYVRDMARAFSIIKKRGNGTLPEWFLGVFDTVGTFPKANWHKQVAAWELCSMEERDMAAALPRTPETLWTTWRARSSGWGKGKGKGKVKNEEAHMD
ncbi:hypothetical protein B0H13DRAFT_2279160 [Mycena leptocephala]|nr:hypothetical protein B0H13DRAFT_2279160 [Mycena leptocephala]